LGAKFFPHRTLGRTRDTGVQHDAFPIPLERLDRQQALVLGALRRAAGRPLTYSELSGAGVEFPASIVSELELAGVPIQRCYGAGGPSVRLDPADDSAAHSASAGHAAGQSASADPRGAGSASSAADQPLATGPRSEPDWSRVHKYRASKRQALFLAALGMLPRAGGKRLLAALALLAAIGVISILVVTWITAGARQTRPPVARRPHHSAVIAAHRGHPATAPAPKPATPPAPSAPPTPVSVALATELEARGHGLLEAGRSADAVPFLRRALLATGEHLSACLEPTSTTCLTYAYALYDLGRAVRLSGNPAAAVPILERRLEIDNQRPTVYAELRLARQGVT
jgi:tetratricopeptide (TPR) repeat protein